MTTKVDQAIDLVKYNFWKRNELKKKEYKLVIIPKGNQAMPPSVSNMFRERVESLGQDTRCYLDLIELRNTQVIKLVIRCYAFDWSEIIKMIEDKVSSYFIDTRPRNPFEGFYSGASQWSNFQWSDDIFEDLMNQYRRGQHRRGQW